MRCYPNTKRSYPLSIGGRERGREREKERASNGELGLIFQKFLFAVLIFETKTIDSCTISSIGIHQHLIWPSVFITFLFNLFWVFLMINVKLSIFKENIGIRRERDETVFFSGMVVLNWSDLYSFLFFSGVRLIFVSWLTTVMKHSMLSLLRPCALNTISTFWRWGYTYVHYWSCTINLSIFRNPLTLKSDWHLISPYNITELNISVTRMKEMIIS